jgi:hypothetical protein
MKDQDVKLNLQAAMNDLCNRFPGRAVAIFVFGSEKGELAHYASNAPREQVLTGLNDLNRSCGFTALPSRKPNN